MRSNLRRAQQGGWLMVVIGAVVAALMFYAWAGSGRVGYLLSGVGFALLLPTYWPASMRPAADGTLVAARPARWTSVAAFGGGVLVLIGLVVTFLA